jgi:DNA repair photolyase
MVTDPAPLQPFEVLNTYQNEIGNLRSHHWKYWLDLYTHCYYDCAYCVYRTGDKMGKIKSHPERIAGLKRDLARMRSRGIVYVGPRTDAYQPLERKERITRAALEALLEAGMPVFIVTRSELILDDVELLTEFARRGLVEISITIASPRVIDELEPHTIPVKKRLELVRQLKGRGIPVSVHMSPILPHVDDVPDLLGLLDDISETNADCTYACMLGMMDEYYGTMEKALKDVAPERRQAFLAAYPSAERKGGVQSAPQDLLWKTMSALSEHCTFRSIPFACVHIPPLDTAERNGGIFRYKQPTVGDMVRHFNRLGVPEIELYMLEAYVRSFPAVEAPFVSAVVDYFEQGLLFKNTHFHPRTVDGKVVGYMRADHLDLRVTNMRVTAAASSRSHLDVVEA